MRRMVSSTSATVPVGMTCRSAFPNSGFTDLGDGFLLAVVLRDVALRGLTTVGAVTGSPAASAPCRRWAHPARAL